MLPSISVPSLSVQYASRLALISSVLDEVREERPHEVPGLKRSPDVEPFFLVLAVISAGRFSEVSASLHLCLSYLGSVPESGLHSFVNLQENKLFFFFHC